MDVNTSFDVVVLGGGNAALCAAITAARAGCKVIVLEGAPEFYRGGNTRHTRNLRCAHDGTAPTPLRPGITFTYLGVRVNPESRMLLADRRAAGNMFAAGEIMAGNVLGKGYLAGIGMTIGAVFGRLAGQGAASHARN
jgi:succinate dehydrogenase/fumarate reductase flavoprotein subunit